LRRGGECAQLLVKKTHSMLNRQPYPA
jgi:hypothetical protein